MKTSLVAMIPVLAILLSGCASGGDWGSGGVYDPLYPPSSVHRGAESQPIRITEVSMVTPTDSDDSWIFVSGLGATFGGEVTIVVGYKDPRPPYSFVYQEFKTTGLSFGVFTHVIRQRCENLKITDQGTVHAKDKETRESSGIVNLDPKIWDCSQR